LAPSVFTLAPALANNATFIQLQTEVQTLQAAAAAAAVPPTGLPTPSVTTLALALANTATFLDLTSSTEAKHFKGATKPLNA
jgi:hypothetical protein